MEQKEQKLPKKPGRKPINIDIVELERLAGMGLSERQIASALDISNSTLTRKKHIKQIEHALKKGRAKAVALVSSKLFDNAMEGKETSAIFFLKNRDPENWKDRQEVINASINLNDVINGAKTRLGGHMTNIIDAKEIKPLHTSDAEGEQLVSKKLQQKKTKG
mgnify:FL=1|tara:strand:- start:338 stop:826 length:489 start_codon:yes stop_codon:yes gene_type:complete